VTDRLLEEESAAYTKVSIWQRGSRYVLRSRLPPRPGKSGRWTQQWLSTGCQANKQGLKFAKAKAAKLESDLLMERFTWDDWLKEGSKRWHGKTARDWIQEFINWKTESVNPENLKSDYIIYTQYLESDDLLTADLLTETCKQITASNSRARKYCVMAYRQLGEFAGLSVNWKGLAGNYTPSSFDPDKLPDDDQIEVIRDAIPSKIYQWVYGMLAVYGLRPHEIYHLDLKRLENDGVVKVLSTTKTGERLVWPCKAEWVEQFRLCDVNPPSCAPGTPNKRLGERISGRFRKYHVPHIPYALRHAYAIRLARFEVPDAFAARWMGHSVSVHTKIYQAAISEREHQEVFSRMVARFGVSREED
jgi:integrase